MLVEFGYVYMLAFEYSQIRKCSV